MLLFTFAGIFIGLALPLFQVSETIGTTLQ